MAAIPRLAAAATEARGLLYPFGEARPEDGGISEVADGVFWVRMPLPFSLDHINLWVLDGQDHWVIVDTGVQTPDIAGFWRALFAGPLAGKPVGRLIVTHYHPDHIGLAGWLSRKAQVPLETSRGEFLLARTLTLDVAPEPPAEALAFYRAHGWAEPWLERLRASGWGQFGRGVSRLPTGFRRLADGDQLLIGGRCWQVLVGAGHSPEHVCLWNREEGLLLAGDQVLPRITSNVSVYPTEPEANPLADWLASIEKLRQVPDRTLVLPAHNEPFTRLHARLDQLDRDHRLKLARLLDGLAEPRHAAECFGALFGRPIGEGEIQMATGEAVAHLRWLEAAGAAERIEADGRIRFRRAA
ncbi:MBL fold metallo-hydrolase [Thermaurantiacus sp.]